MYVMKEPAAYEHRARAYSSSGSSTTAYRLGNVRRSEKQIPAAADVHALERERERALCWTPVERKTNLRVGQMAGEDGERLQ